MVLDKLGGSLKSVLQKVSKSHKVDRELIEEVVKEIQRALISADTNVRLVLDLTKKIRERALKEEVKGLNKQEHLTKLIYEELVKFLGDGKEFELKEGFNKILLIGLYGQGKTTSAGKLGLYFNKRGKKVALLSLDVWRPAAYEQLKQVGDSVGLDVYGDPSISDVEELYNKFKGQLDKYDVVIVDSAGRDNLTEELVEEIEKINEIVVPTDTFLVIGADVGQNAGKQAEAFKEKLDMTGLIITKLDGTGKGGGALSACANVDAPVRFVGTGEKIEDFERFNSENFVSQLLGMGDISGLLEKANLAMEEEQAQDMSYKLMKGTFDLDDLYSQLKSMKKMGSFSKLLKMVPGMGEMNIDESEMQVQEEKLERWKVAMDSMTREEKKNPQLIDISRIRRVSKGSGVPVDEIRELLKQYKRTKKMMKMFKDQDMSDMENMDMKSMMKKAKKKGFR